MYCIGRTPKRALQEHFEGLPRQPKKVHQFEGTLALRKLICQEIGGGSHDNVKQSKAMSRTGSTGGKNGSNTP